MKELWIQIEKNSTYKEKLRKRAAQIADAILEADHAIFNSNHQEVLVLNKFNEDEIKKLKQLGKRIALRVTIKGKGDENVAFRASELSTDYIIINCLNWRVIPLENLIARISGKSKLIAEVENSEDAKLVLEALELGTNGVLLNSNEIEEFEKTATIVKKQIQNMSLTSAKILEAIQIGTGARVCVDTCDLMEPGEGMLVGSQSAGLFLVEAEVHENPYVASRPFRVNAGTLSMYTFGPAHNTRYLSELKAGDEVLIVNRFGKVRKTNVGRTKTEFRPLILVEAEVEGRRIKAVLQNAETIRLVTPNDSIPVTALKKGNEVLVHMGTKGGRHFGISVTEEKVIER